MSGDAPTLLHTALTAGGALAAVLALLWLAQRAARMVRMPGSFPLASRTGAVPPLALLQVLPIDGKRRVHLLGCETGRFLILTGGPQDVMIGPLPGGCP